jgi:hypothetical protein
MSTDGCLACGHPKEGAVQPHHIGCPNKLMFITTVGASDNDLGWAKLCAREGCTNEVPPSKGPRPAKYCDKHKTTRSKK